ncbi:MAG: hypothetical protein ACOX0A_05980 [Thermoguttaceae bacterium]|jgi:hypothetical protein
MMRKSKKRTLDRMKFFHSATICCALGFCSVVAAADGIASGSVESGASERRIEAIPESPTRQSLADILGFDPVTAGSSDNTSSTTAEKKELVNSEHTTAKAEDALERYEAALLADRRIAYGVPRNIDAPRDERQLYPSDEYEIKANNGVDAAVKESPIASATNQTANISDATNVTVPIDESTEHGPAKITRQYGAQTANVPFSTPTSFQPQQFSSSAYGGGAERRVEPQGATLELDDVEQFSHETETRVRDEEDAALEEGAFEAPPEEIDDSVATLLDECYAAIDPYTSLFIYYEPTYEWTESILEYVDSILKSIEESPEQTRALIAELKRKTQEADAIKKKLEAADKAARVSRDPWNGGEQPELCARYTLEERLALVDTFKNALERRVFLWNHAADYFAARNRRALLEPQDVSRQDMAVLLQSTISVREFFGDTPNGRSWRASFDVDALIAELEQALALPPEDPAVVAARAVRKTPNSVGYLGKLAHATQAAPYLDKMLEEEIAPKTELERERARRVQFLQDRINAVAYKLEKTPMTTAQRQVFQRPATAAWSQLITSAAGDQMNGMPLLVAFERYERIGGGDSGRALQQLALRMTTSQSEVCRLYGRAIDVLYDNPNVKAYVSEALINRLLPIRDPEFEVVQETVLNNPVVGRRRVDTLVSIKLVPHPERLLMSLAINGRMHANTSSAVMSARLHNESYANYVGSKTLEWRDTGIAYSPAVVNASSAARLNAIETNVDFVPIVGDLARGITRSQYESRQHAIEAETRAKVINQAQQQFDAEANERLDAVNAKMRAGFFQNLSNLGLALRTQRSRTTDDWLLASLRFGSDYSLGCQTTEPPTLEGAFADIKVHESSVNSFLTQLDLAGRTFTPDEARDFIADRLNKPKIKEIEIEESELSFTFTDADPVTVRFFEDRICLTLRLANLTLGQKSWDDVETEIMYRPTQTPDGKFTFMRDGVIALYGPASVMEQIPIRTVFSKIFPAQKAVDINANTMSKDERFAGLAFGLCRVSRGWFAISVIRDPRFRLELDKTYL